MKNNKSGRIFPLKPVFLLFLRYFSLAILTTIALSGCGSGGGGGGSSTASGTNVLSGTAAAGAPLANGTVTLKDSTGATATKTADAYGNYSFDVSAKRFPVMLQAQPNIPGAAPLFSAALTSGIANTTPLTTLQVFEASGKTDPSTIYTSGDFSKIGSSTLDTGKITVASNFLQQFLNNGLDPGSFDPITTPLVANGVGQDAFMDHNSVSIIGNDVILTDSTGRCIPYGPTNVMTLAVDGMFFADWPAFFGWPYPVPADTTSAFGDDGYVKSALLEVCAPGIDQPRPVLVPNVTNPYVMKSKVPWSRDPTLDYTNSAVKQLILQLKLASQLNNSAKDHGGLAGPINIVAHSWGAVIAYIALTEIAGDDPTVNQTDPTIQDPSIRVAKFITMGSPIECLAGDLVCIKSLFMQQRVPSEFRGSPIRVPSNVTTWTNFVNAADLIASNIVVDENATKLTNEPVANNCPAPPSSGTAGSTPPVASSCNSHSVYFYVGDGFVAPTLFRIRSLIEQSSAEQSTSSTTPSPPPSTTPAPPPLVFSLTAGDPYCDTNTPAGPAAKLTWNASSGAVFYRVFRDGNGVGVNLTASQLSFLNNLGLVAGQTYNYKVQAINASGTTSSNTVPVTIPVAVCASVTDPKITVGPATLNFGSVPVGSCGTATFSVQHVTGTNPASGTVSVGPNPPFSITSGGSFSVSNGSAANVGVQFCPSSVLTYTGTATVTSGATFTGANTVVLSGTGTSTPTCTTSFNTSSGSIDASGGQRQVILTTSDPSCTWSATSNQAWVHDITPSSGTAGATLTYTVDPNNSTQSRSATIMAGQATLTISQLGTSASCTFSLGYTTQSVPANGGTFVEGLLASNQSCPRTAQSNAMFITNVSPASGNGDANISYTVAPNTSTSPRSGTLTIAGLTLTVNQDGAVSTCTYPGAFSLSATPYWDTGSPHSIAASLSWTSSSNETSGYAIYRDGVNIGAVSGTTLLNNPTPPALLAGSSHSYYIMASNACGNTQTNTVSVTLTVQATVSNTGGVGLNLRSAAGYTSTEIANLPDGTIVTVYGGPTYAPISSTSSGWWWQVSTPYGSGWVWGDYLY